MYKSSILHIIIVLSTLLLIGCKHEVIEQEVIVEHIDSEVNTEKVADLTTKIDWITSRLKDEENKIKDNTIDNSIIQIRLNGDNLDIPIKSTELTELGLVDNSDFTIESKSVSYGNYRRLDDKYDKTLKVEYMNKLEKDLDIESCLVSHIEDTCGLVELVIKSSDDNQQTICITNKTSLDNILEQLNKLDIDIDNTCGIEIHNNEYLDKWIIKIDTHQINKVKTIVDKFTPNELENKQYSEIYNISYLLKGTLLDGVNYIEIDYNIVNVNELAYRYDMLNK